MARGSNQRKPKDDDHGEPVDRGPAATRPAGGRQTRSQWFEEAWQGWLKPVGGIVLLVVAYFAYTSTIVPEDTAGRMLLIVIFGGAIYAGIEPALGRFTAPRDRYLLLAGGVVWAVVAAAPVFRTVFPGKALGEVTIGATKDANSASITVEGGYKGPYAITVSGHLKGTGEVDAAYELEITGAGESSERVAGELKRTYFNQRVSRRGSSTIAVRQENTETLHRVTRAIGPDLKITGEVGSEMLEDGLRLTFRGAGPSPFLAFVIGLLLVAGAILFDYRMVSPRAERTHASAWTGFTLVFGAYFAMEATPHNLVRQAIAGILVGAGVGALPGWAVSAIVNSFRPRPKKLAGTKNRFAEDE